MTPKQRLLRTLNGLSVDRPAVCFYELNGIDEDVLDTNSFNIYSHPSWKELILLTRERTDRIVMRPVEFKCAEFDPLKELTTVEQNLDQNGSLLTTTQIRAGSRVLSSLTRRDPDTNTIWTLEHLLKDNDDIKAYLQLPEVCRSEFNNFQNVLETEGILGEQGIVMLDTPDPLCMAAQLFDMSTFTMIAMYEQKLFTMLVERFARKLLSEIAVASKALPGRLWRIYGPEYASPPYLTPSLFREYVVKFDNLIIKSIHGNSGYARIHCHGNIREIIDDIVSMGADAIDPIEPPPQGNVELSYIRQKYGKQLVLFGNLEISDIENLPTDEFEQKVVTALKQGTAGQGRGFVLMPSACPYGRFLSSQTLHNYIRMVELAEQWQR